VQVFYDYEKKASMPCSADMRRKLEAFEGRSLEREVRS
jgi:hypothetical protein